MVKETKPLSNQATIVLNSVSYYYGDIPALREINLRANANEILAVFGPAMSGKSTLLRLLNRLSDLATEGRLEGEVLLDAKNIHDPDVSVTQLRKRVGIVFAVPVPLPMSIWDNITYGPLLSGRNSKNELDELVEPSRCAKPPSSKRTPITSRQRQRALAEADAILERAGI